MFNVSFKKIQDGQFLLIDESVYIQILDVEHNVKIKTPSKEEIIVVLPEGKAVHFFTKDVVMEDGVYVLERKGSIIKKGFYPVLERTIHDLILKTKNIDFFREIQDKFLMLNILAEHDDEEGARVIYEDIHDFIKGCSGRGFFSCKGS